MYVHQYAWSLSNKLIKLKLRNCYFPQSCYEALWDLVGQNHKQQMSWRTALLPSELCCSLYSANYHHGRNALTSTVEFLYSTLQMIRRA